MVEASHFRVFIWPLVCSAAIAGIDASMPQYDLHILCQDCGSFHDAFLRVTLDESFEVRRVSDVYPQGIPLEFYQAIAQIHCSKTDRRVEQKSPELMVLVAIGRWSKPQSAKLPKK